MKPLNVPGTLDSLRVVAEFVQGVATATNLDMKDAYRLRLAVDEIVTNIITHGYEEAELQSRIDLRAEVNHDTVAILIEDSGVAFDPLQHMLPDNLDQPLDERVAGGLGVYLVRHSVDELLYERVRDRNRNILVMNRPAEATAATVTEVGSVSRGNEPGPGRILIVDQAGEDHETLCSDISMLASRRDPAPET